MQSAFLSRHQTILPIVAGSDFASRTFDDQFFNEHHLSLETTQLLGCNDWRLKSNATLQCSIFVLLTSTNDTDNNGILMIP